MYRSLSLYGRGICKSCTMNCATLIKASRIHRDMSDIRKLVEVFNESGVFSTSFTKLVSLSKGLIADEFVNAENAKSVGAKILQGMVGETISAYSFPQKKQAKTLASAAYVKTLFEGQVELDPQRFYQRLLLMGVEDMPLAELLGYELCLISTGRS